MMRGILRHNDYAFVDKHSIVARIRTAIQDSGEPLEYIARGAHVSRKTLEGWLSGKTKNPYSTNLESVARALGMRLELVGGQLRLIDNSSPGPVESVGRRQRWRDWRRSP
jgi:transcriptional regulator with XRE-family HTH domain